MKFCVLYMVHAQGVLIVWVGFNGVARRVPGSRLREEKEWRGGKRRSLD